MWWCSAATPEARHPWRLLRLRFRSSSWRLGIAEQDLVSVAAGHGTHAARKAIRGLSGLLHYPREAYEQCQGGCGLFQHECETDRYQRRGKLRRPGHEPPLRTGHCGIICICSQHAGVSAQRPVPDKATLMEALLAG